MERELVCEIKCPRPDCAQKAKVYIDERSGNWLRSECTVGHWGDIGPDSCLLPEEIQKSLKARGIS
jgi:hypothetical protein